MITTYHSQAFHNQMQRMPWSADELYDFDLPEFSSGVTKEQPEAAVACDLEEREALLNHLRHLTITSLSSFEEIASATTNLHLSSFAHVIVRQRAAQQYALYEAMDYASANEADVMSESLAVLRSLWRGAIWNLEQGHHGLFLEYADRAESLLEEACLSAAQGLGDDPLADQLRGYAIMVCGSRGLIEELADRMPRHVPGQFKDSRTSKQEMSADPGGLSQVVATSKSKQPSATLPREGEKWRRAMAPAPFTTATVVRSAKQLDWKKTRADQLSPTAKVRGSSRSRGSATRAGR